jgi:asparagine synthase (glutamine-hydrolysing)
VCGISGIYNLSGNPVDERQAARISALLRHRGPDEEGTFCSGKRDLVLSHRRLSIIDLETGRQPLLSEDGKLALVCNGEIYNFRELRKDLERRGHRFRTSTDVEVILHLYEERGDDCILPLRGMFAFVLYDGRKDRLLLARDRAGQKPLYHAECGESFVFASEFRALARGLSLRPELDYRALDAFLTFGYIPSPHTIFLTVRKLPPAHRGVVERGAGLKIERYWRPEFLPKLEIDFQEAKTELLQKLREAAEMQTVADVPVGCFLSGGLDSSAVALQLAGGSGRPFHTFTAGFGEADFDERKYAETVAQRIGSVHHVLEIEPAPPEIIEEVVRGYGEPFGDSSALPTWLLSREARKIVKVALNGDGGDELFAGYTRYPIAAVLGRFGRLAPHALSSLLARAAGGKAGLRKVSRALTLLGGSPRDCFFELSSTFSVASRRSLYSDDFIRKVDGGPIGMASWEPDPGLHFLDAMLMADTLYYLPEDLLTKIDVATMAHSLEGRSPFLDHHLMEFAFRLPPAYKLRGRTTKVILRRALESELPGPLLKRKKMGFGVPIRCWFRGDLSGFVRSGIESGLRLLPGGLFRAGAVEKLIAEHAGGIEHQHRLWSLLVLSLWAKEYL